MNNVANAAQLAAIYAPLSPQLVIAGAGSGKTYVLTERIIYLIKQKGLDPNRILAITFTNKAANEMSTRVKKATNMTVSNIGTFHAMCRKLLIAKIHLLGYSNKFKIISPQQQGMAIRRLSKPYEHIDAKKHMKNSRIRELILCYKLLGMKPDDLSPEMFKRKINHLLAKVDLSEAHHVFVSIWRDYLKDAKENNMLDFDDLLILANQAMSIHECQAYWANKFDAILIDEFQDTDPIQWSIVKKMMITHSNIFAVGDPDQSIYGWRGAVATIFKDFKDVFPDTNIIKLEQNYRSSSPILSAANELIANNWSEDDFTKKLYTLRKGGLMVSCGYFESVYDEINWVVNKIKYLKQKDKHFSYGDVAILYRINSLSKEVEETLINNNISYKLSKGAKFYEIKEIGGILGYLQLYLSDDKVSIHDCINTPKRSITENTLIKLNYYATANNISLLTAMRRVDFIKSISKQGINGIKEFLNHIDKIRKIEYSSFRNLVDQIIEITDYYRDLDLDYNKDQAKVDYVNYLKDTMDDYQTNKRDASLQDYLDDISLYLNVDESNPSDMSGSISKDKINLMTIHSAKGLEFKYVFVIRISDGILPYYRGLGTDTIMEERRLLYVAMTRAKDVLVLSGSESGVYSNRISSDSDNEFFTHKKDTDDDYKSYYFSDIKSCPYLVWDNRTRSNSGIVSKILSWRS